MDAANLNAFQITPSTNKDTNCCTAIHVFALVVSISCYAPDTTIPSNCNFGYPDVSRQNNHPTKTELTVERRFHQDSDEGHYDTGTGAYAIDCGSIICNPSQCTDHVQRPQFQDINWKAGIAMFEYSTSSMNVSISTSKLRDTKVHPNRDDYSFNGSWEIFSCSQQKEHREDVYFPQRKGRVNFVTPSIDVPSSYATSPVAWELQPLCQGGSARTRKLLGVSINSARSKRQGEDGAIAASGVFGFICFSVGLLLWCMRRNTKVDVELESMLHPQLWRGTGPVRFSYSELVAATSNFAEENQLGRGGFGQVYRGRLVSDQNRQVAVKMFSSESPSQGRKEFEAEVKVMSQLRHRNLVQLVGWCDSPEQLLLVYELASEGSLDKHLYDYGGRLLTWPERYKIALGVGSAVLYLHTECERCVVHGDIKPSNVMLDSSLGSKLGDFGLARLVDHGAEPQTTHVIAGTPGYIDPEFINTQRPSTESDVYSFGVVLMEIASGRRPTATSVQPGEAPALLRRVRDLYDQDAILDAADDRLNGEFDDQQMESVLVTGLWCAHPDRSQRPSIAQAMAALRCEDGGLPVLPELHGTGQIRALEEQAYGDLLAEVSGSTRSSAATAYHTPEVSSYLYVVE